MAESSGNGAVAPPAELPPFESVCEPRCWTIGSAKNLKLRWDGERVHIPSLPDGQHVRYHPSPPKGTPKMLAPNGVPRPLWWLSGAPLPTGWTWLVEGEPDAIALHSCGIKGVVAVPGSSAWKAEYAPDFAGLDVVIVTDYDAAGRKLAEKAANDLAGVAGSVRVLDYRDEPPDRFDLTDFIREQDGPSSARTILNGLAGDTEPWGFLEGPAHSWRIRHLANTERLDQPPPIVGGMFYPAARHIVYGLSEAGKSWLALWACIVEARRGRNSVYIDLEMGIHMTALRLRLLGATDAELERIAYIYPSEPLAGALLDETATVLADLEPTLVVVDAFDAFLSLHDLDPNVTRDVEQCWQRLDHISVRIGAGLVVLDHVTNDASNRDRPIGSQRKFSGSDVALSLQTIGVPVQPGRAGITAMRARKDRPAGYRRGQGGRIGDITIDAVVADLVTVKINLTPDFAGPVTKEGAPRFRPTVIMQKVSAHLYEHDRSSSEPVEFPAISERVVGRTTTIRDALEQLVADGFVQLHVNGRKRSYSHIHSFFASNVQDDELTPPRYGPETLPMPTENDSGESPTDGDSPETPYWQKD